MKLQRVDLWLKRYEKKQNTEEIRQIQSELEFFSGLSRRTVLNNSETNKLANQTIELLKKRLLELTDSGPKCDENIKTQYEGVMK